ncbi:MAG: hypothetical protein VX498_15695 [Myxococcota bacterium]|nr:hypothetical protein [Myxococcota bacterium]
MRFVSLHTPALLLGATLLSALSGCEDSCDELEGEEHWLEAGTGDQNFEALSEGQSVTAAWGSQGGQHVWGSLRAGGVHRGPLIRTPNNFESQPEITFALESEELLLGQFGPSNQTVFRRPDGSAEFVGGTVFIMMNPWDTSELFPEGYNPDTVVEEEERVLAWAYAIEQLEARDWLLTASLTDRCGNTVTDQRTLKLNGLERW